MAESGPVNNVTLGGLTFNSNQATDYGKTQKDGTFFINFKTGEKLVYPEQPVQVACKKEEATYAVLHNGKRVEPDSWEFKRANDKTATFHRELQPRVETRVTNEGIKYDDTYFNISNVMGATFSSSDYTITNVNLENSYGCQVDLSANNSLRYADNAKITGGANNTVKLDMVDTAQINGKQISGEGVAAQKDYEK